MLVVCYMWCGRFGEGVRWKHRELTWPALTSLGGATPPTYSRTASVPEDRFHSKFLIYGAALLTPSPHSDVWAQITFILME
jgi:hypothetical protein